MAPPIIPGVWNDLVQFWEDTKAQPYLASGICIGIILLYWFMSKLGPSKR